MTVQLDLSDALEVFWVNQDLLLVTDRIEWGVLLVGVQEGLVLAELQQKTYSMGVQSVCVSPLLLAISFHEQQLLLAHPNTLQEVTRVDLLHPKQPNLPTLYGSLQESDLVFSAIDTRRLNS